MPVVCVPPNIEPSGLDIDSTEKSVYITTDSILDIDLSRKAKMLCDAAMKAPYWKAVGATADNTSCIIIQFNNNL